MWFTTFTAARPRRFLRERQAHVTASATRPINTLNFIITRRLRLYYSGDNKKRTLSNNNSHYSVGPEFPSPIDLVPNSVSQTMQSKPSTNDLLLRDSTIKR